MVNVPASGGTVVRSTTRKFGPLPPPFGTPYVVRQVMTVADVFGATAKPVMVRGTLSTADVIEMPNGDQIWYQDNTQMWRLKPVSGSILSHQGKTPIVFVQGFIFHRRGTIDLPITVTGDVKTTPTWMSLNHFLVRQGLSMNALVSTITSTTRPTKPNPLLLATSGLYTGFLTTGLAWDDDGTLTKAEIVNIQNPIGAFDSYYYYNDGTSNNSWYDGNANLSNSVELPSGVIIERKRATVLIKWLP